MAIEVTCGCGASYSLKDEFAGRVMQCPACQQSFRAVAAPPLAARAQADPAFDRDKFLLRQKVIAINEKYFVSDESNQPIIYIERPAHLGQNLLAAFAGIIAGAVVCGGVIFLGSTIADFRNESALILFIVVGVVLGVAAAIADGVPLSAKRHVSFYRDPSKTHRLMDVLQDRKFQPINATYTVRDGSQQIIARLHKNVFYNLIRKRWYCYAPDGSIICIAKEDSIILSLLRRFLGTFYGLLRTNFIFCVNGEQVIGEFNRKFTLFDRYVLDLSADPTRSLDRRIALGLGVMLDTGERR